MPTSQSFIFSCIVNEKTTTAALGKTLKSQWYQSNTARRYKYRHVTSGFLLGKISIERQFETTRCNHMHSSFFSFFLHEDSLQPWKSLVLHLGDQARLFVFNALYLCSLVSFFFLYFSCTNVNFQITHCAPSGQDKQSTFTRAVCSTHHRFQQMFHIACFLTLNN